MPNTNVISEAAVSRPIVYGNAAATICETVAGKKRIE